MKKKSFYWSNPKLSIGTVDVSRKKILVVSNYFLSCLACLLMLENRLLSLVFPLFRDLKRLKQPSHLRGHSITTWTRWGGGAKMFVFVHAQGIRLFRQGGRGEKNYIHVVVECPLMTSYFLKGFWESKCNLFMLIFTKSYWLQAKATSYIDCIWQRTTPVKHWQQWPTSWSLHVAAWQLHSNICQTSPCELCKTNSYDYFF